MIEKTFIKKNYNKMELEGYLSKKLDKAGFDGLDIIKTPLVTRLVLHVAKPGLAIGKNGSTIKELTELVSQKYGIDNPQIEIKEIKNANLNAKLIAKKMASMIESGFSWRSVAYRSIKDILSANAQGVELVFKGALAGKGGRKRKQRIAVGYMKKIGHQRKFVDTAKVPCYPKAGAIGIKLSIIHPNVIFPDKINVNDVMTNLKLVKQQLKEQESKDAETKEDVKDESKEKVKNEVKEESKEETKKVKVETKEKSKEDSKDESKEEIKKVKVETKEKSKEDSKVEVKEDSKDESKEKINKEVKEEN
jgi:small subunit ribosomal protein S3